MISTTSSNTQLFSIPFVWDFSMHQSKGVVMVSSDYKVGKPKKYELKEEKEKIAYF
jgi:hypothetical protein